MAFQNPLAIWPILLISIRDDWHTFSSEFSHKFSSKWAICTNFECVRMYITIRNSLHFWRILVNVITHLVSFWMFARINRTVQDVLLLSLYFLFSSSIPFLSFVNRATSRMKTIFSWCLVFFKLKLNEHMVALPVFCKLKLNVSVCVCLCARARIFSVIPCRLVFPLPSDDDIYTCPIFHFFLYLFSQLKTVASSICSSHFVAANLSP